MESAIGSDLTRGLVHVHEAVEAERNGRAIAPMKIATASTSLTGSELWNHEKTWRATILHPSRPSNCRSLLRSGLRCAPVRSRADAGGAVSDLCRRLDGTSASAEMSAFVKFTGWALFLLGIVLIEFGSSGGEISEEAQAVSLLGPLTCRPSGPSSSAAGSRPVRQRFILLGDIGSELHALRTEAPLFIVRSQAGEFAA